MSWAEPATARVSRYKDMHPQLIWDLGGVATPIDWADEPFNTGAVRTDYAILLQLGPQLYRRAHPSGAAPNGLNSLNRLRPSPLFRCKLLSLPGWATARLAFHEPHDSMI